jgi:hypothetical protein
MGRPKKYYSVEQIQANKIIKNKLTYNKILASQTDKKRFNKSCDLILRYFSGVEILNKTHDDKITIETAQIEQILKKAKAINLAVNIENSVKKMIIHREEEPEEQTEELN